MAMDDSRRKAKPYAGFWRRLLALLIDAFLLFFVFSLIDEVTDGAATQDMLHIDPARTSTREIGFQLPLTFFGSLIAFLGSWLYYTWMESSSLQATFGKMAIGIVVTDLDGNPITFGRAARRSLAKFLSAITLFSGFLMAGTTPQKQALHDIMAHTLVMKQGAVAPA